MREWQTGGEGDWKMKRKKGEKRASGLQLSYSLFDLSKIKNKKNKQTTEQQNEKEKYTDNRMFVNKYILNNYTISSGNFHFEKCRVPHESETRKF